jgi:hypothetical protein
MDFFFALWSSSMGELRWQSKATIRPTKGQDVGTLRRIEKAKRAT